jgi:hypothetical protein
MLSQTTILSFLVAAAVVGLIVGVLRGHRLW